MKIIADKAKFGDIPSDRASNEEILQYLRQRVVEKYPQGGVKAYARMQSKRLGIDSQVLYVRTTSSLPAKIGWTSVYCEVFITRDEGKMEIEISAEPGVFRDDSIKHLLSWFNVAKRDVLVADVKGWIEQFLQQSDPGPVAAEAPAAGALPPKCQCCGAVIPGQASVCPGCGASLSETVPSASAPAASVPPAGAPPVAPAPQAPRAASVQQPVSAQPTPKSKSTFVLLGALLGGLGIHNFYAGYKNRAIVQLMVFIATLGYGIVITWGWAIYEICTVKQDANGIPFA